MNVKSMHTPCTHLNQESELLYNWWFTANQFVLVPRPLRPMTSIFFFQLNTCCYSIYVTSSLMRGWVCHLQILLAVASKVILGSKSCGTQTIFYCLRLKNPQPGEPGSCIYIPQEQGGPVIPPGTGFTHLTDCSPTISLRMMNQL
jgi:hypothetical protein